jgi:hypothetical protein
VAGAGHPGSPLAEVHDPDERPIGAHTGLDFPGFGCTGNSPFWQRLVGCCEAGAPPGLSVTGGVIDHGGRFNTPHARVQRDQWIYR